MSSAQALVWFIALFSSVLILSAALVSDTDYALDESNVNSLDRGKGSFSLLSSHHYPSRLSPPKILHLHPNSSKMLLRDLNPFFFGVA
ncbi:unnamed protein product [Allacma fusca]|uniref:Uncharacterized protein n=1 Tax=Allacma fusca TaxID=39272 RepID=A0A8J2K0I4_9HEXA|nr:unnamed protein product [Allacma fusca]